MLFLSPLFSVMEQYLHGLCYWTLVKYNFVSHRAIKAEFIRSLPLSVYSIPEDAPATKRPRVGTAIDVDKFVPPDQLVDVVRTKEPMGVLWPEF